MTPADLLDWAEVQPWAVQMRSCPQDRRYHQEGDVWTHTKAVCRELMDQPAWQELSPKERRILLLAALLHDVGKPATTETDGRSVTAQKHSIVGARMARRILAEARVPFREREDIVTLVRYHTSPANLIRKTDPHRSAIELSWLTNPRWLYSLAVADSLGRVADDHSEFRERIELFREYLSDQNCFGQRFEFASDHARFLYFRRQLESLHYTPYENFTCMVTIISGLPASGKNHWLRTAGKDPTISLDGIRQELGIKPTDNQGQVIQEARRRFRSYLANRQSFNFNATNTVRATRDRWIRLAYDYGAEVLIVYVERPLNVMLPANRKRGEMVPEEVWWKLFDRLEVPNLTESHGLKLIVL